MMVLKTEKRICKCAIFIGIVMGPSTLMLFTKTPRAAATTTEIARGNKRKEITCNNKECCGTFTNTVRATTEQDHL